MPRLACPSCNRKLKVPQYVVAVTIRCPNCSTVFEAGAEMPAVTVGPPAPLRTEPPPRTTPLLTSPHPCHHCGSPLSTPVGRSAATVVCPSCGNKTSVYAVLHACPSCGRLLESPSRSSGTETACPACTKSVRVPRDVVLKEPPSYSDDFRLGFCCPACGGELIAKEADVGTYAVCAHCMVPLVVPNAGHHPQGTRPTPGRDPLDSLHTIKKVHCTRCKTRFPASASSCPVCGARTPSASP